MAAMNRKRLLRRYGEFSLRAHWYSSTAQFAASYGPFIRIGSCPLLCCLGAIHTALAILQEELHP
jgi:hypothetical protein